MRFKNFEFLKELQIFYLQRFCKNLEKLIKKVKDHSPTRKACAIYESPFPPFYLLFFQKRTVKKKQGQGELHRPYRR
jgi:beta-galactosidase beta subunit